MGIRLASRPLSVAAAYRELEATGLGGIVLFVGRVRPDRDRATEVEALLYEADRPVALAQLAKIDRTARSRFGATRTVLWHRLGRVSVNEIAVITGAASGHRAEAFRAARYLIEEVKRSVPIWKELRGRPARRRRPPPGRRAGRSAD